MANYIIYLAYSIIVGIFVFIPELFPRCANCGKHKPRFLFKLHKSVSLSLTYKGNLSVCKKCFIREEITSFEKLKTKQDISKRAKYKARFMVK